MSGCRPLIKGYFGVALVVGAVMSSASHEGLLRQGVFLPMPIRGELSFTQGLPC
jgi:hypothetical protein